MATSESTARAKVTLDSSSFEKGAKAIESAAEAMGEVVQTVFAAAAVAMSAFVAGIGLLGYEVKQVVEFGEAMANAGHAANIAAGRFYLFHNAVEKGLSLKTVANLIGENAEVLNRSSAVFRDVALKLWVVGEKIRGFWLGLVDRLAPVLSRLLDGALAVSLVHAGQVFGEALADAVEVVYQLAKDGNLWGTIKEGFKIAFQYAAERLVWLGGLAFSIFNFAIGKAFLSAISSIPGLLLKALEVVAINFAKSFKDNLLMAFLGIVKVVDSLLARVDEGLNKTHVISDKTLAERNKGREDFEKSIQDNIGGSSSSNTADTVAQLAKILSESKFQGSDSLNQNIEDFSKTIQDALAGYKKDEKDSPPTTFENNTRRQAFGADSLAAIGAGGNVYTGLSVLDVNRQQLDQLKQINSKLGGVRPASYGFAPTPNTQTNSISRTQTSDVITQE